MSAGSSKATTKFLSSFRRGALPVAGVIVLMLAACGAGADDGDVSDDRESDPDSASDPVKEEALELVTEFTEQPESIGITEGYDEPIPDDKVIAFMTCDLSSCTQIAEIVEEGADELGWTVDRINIGSTPETVKSGYEEAVRREPDAVLGTGLGPELFSDELGELEAKNIPVILSSVAQDDDRLAALFMGTESIARAGEAQAIWTLAEYGSEANTLVVDVPDLTTIHAWFEGFKAKYSELCPECEINEVSFASADIGTPKTSSQMASFVQSHPDVNAIQMATSEIAHGLPASLNTLDWDGAVGVLNADDTVRDYMAEGAVTISNEVDWPTAVWKMLDTAARVFTNQSTAPDVEAPENVWIYTADNMPEGSGYSTPIVLDYQEQFKDIWETAS